MTLLEKYKLQLATLNLKLSPTRNEQVKARCYRKFIKDLELSRPIEVSEVSKLKSFIDDLIDCKTGIEYSGKLDELLKYISDM